MKHFEIPYDRKTIPCEIEEKNLLDVIEPRFIEADDQAAVVRDALQNPIGTPTLKELTKNVKKVVLISSDNTRPVPSRLTLPLILREFARPIEDYDLTILVATGLHHAVGEAELIERFGEDLYRRGIIKNHDALDDEQMTFLGTLPSGGPVYVNRLVAEAELVIAEGFIEPHFFAGYSGGRKSILPGVSSHKTIFFNHRPWNLAHPNARTGILEGNPVHEECEAAAKMAKLAFILNVCLNKEKEVVAAYAGDLVQAHRAGCRFVKEHMTVPTSECDIIITSNNGYPLDRNLYQIVKGMDAAAHAVRKGGVIILAAGCRDGVGHEHYAEYIEQSPTLEDLLARCNEGELPVSDQWQVQIYARVLDHATVILVSDGISKELAERHFMRHASTLEEALQLAYSLTSPDAKVSILPEGPVVIPVVEK